MKVAQPSTSFTVQTHRNQPNVKFPSGLANNESKHLKVFAFLFAKRYNERDCKKVNRSPGESAKSGQCLKSLNKPNLSIYKIRIDVLGNSYCVKKKEMNYDYI